MNVLPQGPTLGALRDLAVVMPVYNEADCIAEVVQSWIDTLERLGISFCLVVLNDGSKDTTQQRLEAFATDSRVVAINKQNAGHGPTILQGYGMAVDMAPWVFQCDSDNEMHAAHFDRLWKRRDQYDALFGVRSGRKQQADRKLISFVSRAAIQMLFGRGVVDVNTPYRLMRSYYLKQIIPQIPGNTFAPNLIISGTFRAARLRIANESVPHEGRRTGQVSIMKWKLWKAAGRALLANLVVPPDPQTRRRQPAVQPRRLKARYLRKGMNMKNSGRIVILGAGPTGLGAAYQLQQAGFDNWAIFERENVVGGLARSVLDDRGFTWDLGGHVAFSHYGVFSRLIKTLLGPDGLIEHERESWVRLLDTWVPYPFQNNIHRLPPPQRAQCLQGLIEAALNRAAVPRDDFEQFILQVFGRGIADIFMLPYNFKVWAYRPCRLNANWIGERVAVPDPIRAARNVAIGQDDVSWGPNNKFGFPTRGGTGAIWTALAKSLPPGRMHLAHEAIEIDVSARIVRFANGKTDSYDELISSIPLDRLACISARSHWMETASRLLRSFDLYYWRRT